MIHNRVKFLVGIASISFVILLVSYMTPSFIQNALAHDCQFQRNVPIEVFDFEVWDGWYIDNIDSLLLLDGESFWRGYEAEKPFAVPDDASIRWQITWSNWQLIIIDYAESTPDVVYVWMFDVPVSRVDADHPCAVLVMDLVEVEAALAPQ